MLLSLKEGKQLKNYISELIKNIDLSLIFIGIAGLFFGILVYLIDRPPEQTYFISKIGVDISFYKNCPNLFGIISNCLPSFFHVFSFILITAGLISYGQKFYLIISLSWIFIDCIFELGQKFKLLALKLIPGWFENILFLENSANYFIKGTFDSLDLVAITLGGVMAYLFLIIFKRRI